MEKYSFHSDLYDFINTNTILSFLLKPFSLNWDIYLKEDKKYIGNIEMRCEKRSFQECEIGYVIGEPFQRKGHATNCVKEVLDYMKHAFSTQIVFAEYFNVNIASSKVLKKNGFNIVSDNTIIVKVKKEL